MFKLGDYAIDDGYGVVLHLTSDFHVQIINAQGSYRHATPEEIEGYHWEEYE